MRWNNDEGRRRPLDSILTGVIIAVAGAVYWRFNPHAWWMIFPVIFGGALPASRGIQRLISERMAKPRIERVTESQRNSDNERIVLRIAQAQNGVVTPSQIVVNSTMNLDEAERILDSLAKKGHAGMQVLDDGRINYEFKEFRR